MLVVGRHLRSATEEALDMKVDAVDADPKGDVPHLTPSHHSKTRSPVPQKQTGWPSRRAPVHSVFQSAD